MVGHQTDIVKGLKDPPMHPVRHHFCSRARNTLPCTPSVTIFAQGPSHAPRSSPFLLKGLKGPPMHPVRHHFCSRAKEPSARARRKRRCLSSSMLKLL